MPVNRAFSLYAVYMHVLGERVCESLGSYSLWHSPTTIGGWLVVTMTAAPR